MMKVMKNCFLALGISCIVLFVYQLTLQYKIDMTCALSVVESTVVKIQKKTEKIRYV